ncbi:uncharacterized protein LOC128554720 [Mercenaria mercenaria]|uniref:uncharacterized protein LOC128554720 n=1 Tax=Mercenaria mercenaria TaxID=6596 RepID=UPI00234E540A|nr:uncharacterized protein LOC128554720 [Mercenaria mercenaria]XP_053392008.1 uncharacterized protein LOC128554720 [Mercenaria mercenaria]
MGTYLDQCRTYSFGEREVYFSGVHQTRFRYARLVQENGRWRLEIKNTNSAREQTQSTQNNASQKPLKCDTQRRQYPHGERGNNHLDRNHSEATSELSCERYSHQAESSGIQETVHLQELNYRTPHGDQGWHAAGPYMHEFHDPSSSTTAAIDRELVNYHLDSDEVRMVLSEGYSLTDMTYVVEAILRGSDIYIFKLDYTKYMESYPTQPGIGVLPCPHHCLSL